MDQLNFFLVAHLKSVPLEKLGQKIKETFLRIDLDNSGELSKAEVGAAFERLGKPLKPSDLDAYMDSVDVDGNGVVDVHEFEHMTRKLLAVGCIPSCMCCRCLHQAGKEDNWGVNKSEALEILEQEKAARDHAAESSDLFMRVGSAPGTPLESDQAEEEAIKRRAAKIEKDKKKKDAQLKAAIKSPTARPKVMKKTPSGNSLARTDSSSSMVDSPCAANSPQTLTSKTTSPSRVTSKLHDAIAKSSPDQVRAM